ncbi:cytochrome c oxidase subunit I [Acidithrix ferrooxidans]|uniref:Cytochrome c oxidase subunit 1 n=1 Tax=Acidithrix ferrooxidans TaxID=1280514 RepID=A0A0D8HG45_9ACTN|nr:cbb3-type cytochrome c oxidase subunit I [Acidithrix ferrooxidans]KJF16787.1 cytochrome c oxidase subunit 1 [Acidithrix ferrooxidans]
MAIDFSKETESGSSSGTPGTSGKGIFSPSIITGAVAGGIGYLFGHWMGNAIAGGYPQVIGSGQNDVAICLGYAFAVVGWFAGLGALNYPIKKMLGYEPDFSEPELKPGWTKYFQYTQDHKIVGIQYLFGMLVYFFTAGLLALAIRTELLSPTHHIWGPSTYLEIVGEHGTMMMMMMTSVVLGPFGNFMIPLMIGSKKVAFPRLEAASFWFTPISYVILLSALWQGGFQSGWTSYAPLSIQQGVGQDAYIFGFGLQGLSMVCASTNIVATIINYRAPGMTWNRLNIMGWSMLSLGFTMILSVPVLIDGLYVLTLDRTAQTSMLYGPHGGSSFLWENLFWFFGHPEVYLLAIPGFGMVAEIIPVFARKPIFGYKTSAAGMIGLAVLSFFVWQHHLFQSGMNPDMRPLFMLTTELISIPTGFIYLVGMGTLWKARIRLTVPMLFMLGVYFNFLFGGLTGVYVSDVPINVTVHGSFFVMAHFHYTIMGGVIFAFFGAIYYYTPLVTGFQLNQKWGKIHFWSMMISFNSTFLPLFAVGLLGQPRRVFEYAQRLQTLNDWVSISSYVLGLSLTFFVVTFLWQLVVTRTPAVRNPWGSRSLEWHVDSYPPPQHNFKTVPVVMAGPYEYADLDALPMADIVVENADKDVVRTGGKA